MMYRVKSCCLGVLLLAGMLLSVVATARVVDRIAAVVNDEVILLSEVDRRCQAALSELPASLPLEQQVERKHQIRKTALDQLIDDLLIKQKVREHQVQTSDEEVKRSIEQLKKDNNLNDQQFEEALKMEGKTLSDLQAEIRSQMERSKLIEVQMRNNPEMRSQVQIGEQDVADYYRSHYSTSEKVRASHILFAAPQGSTNQDVEKARQRAEQVRSQVQSGAAFDEMAKEHSDDPSGTLGGDLGWFRRGDMVAPFEKAAFSLAKGKVSEPVRTQFGFHLIKVVDRASEDAVPLEKVRGKIQQQLYHEKFQRSMRGWLDDMRRRSFIEIKL